MVIKISDMQVIDRYLKLKDWRYLPTCTTAIDECGCITIVDEDKDDALVGTLAHYSVLLPVAQTHFAG